MSRGPWKKKYYADKDLPEFTPTISPVQEIDKTFPIQETYPAEQPKKLILHACVYPIKWEGDTYNSAGVWIDHCCQESIDKCNEFYPHKTTTREPQWFLRMIYNGRPVDNCPFCGAEIDLRIEPRESRKDWF